MKKLSLIMVCFAALAFVSCSGAGNLGKVTSSNTAATACGTACGQALVSLFNSYKANGKNIDLTSSANINSALALVTAYTQLKDNKGNSDYRKAFTTGVVMGSAGLITSANASTIVNKIANSAGLSNTTRNNISTATSTITSILSLLQ